MVKESKVFLAFVAAAIGLASSAFAANPPSADYVILDTDCNSPTKLGDDNADTIKVTAANVGQDLFNAVSSSTYWKWGYFASSMTGPDGVNLFETFPTFCRWHKYGATETAEERVKYCPPNENYDYWLNKTLATPNDQISADTHHGANYVYKFRGRSLTISGGSLNFCHKGTTTADFGENVTIGDGGCSFLYPALGSGRPHSRGKARIENGSWVNFNCGSGMTASKTACFLDWSLSSDDPVTATLAFYDDTDRCATWYWCGDCSDYHGKMVIAANAKTTKSINSVLVISNVTMGGSVEIQKYGTLKMLGAGASIGGAVDIQRLATFELTSGITSKVGSLNVDGSLKFMGKTSKLKVAQMLTFGDEATVAIPADMEGAIITVPNAVATETLKEFSAVLARDGITVALKLEDSAETGYKDIVIANPESAKNKTIDIDSEMSLSCGNARYHVNVKNGATLNVVGNAGGAMPINLQGGSVEILAQQMAEWGTIPSLWLDASSDTSISNIVIDYADSTYNYGDKSKTGCFIKVGETFCDEDGNPFIKGWFDCRETKKTLKLWNDRYDRAYTKENVTSHAVMFGTHPRRVKGGCNGMDYISFDKATPKAKITFSDDSVETVNPNPNGWTRIYMTPYNAAVTTTGGAVVAPRYAFFVFGSQNGGGDALLAKGSPNPLLRAGTLRNHTHSDPMFASNTAHADVWIDGVQKDPTTTGFNGGWEIITIDMHSTTNKFNGLGYATNGGGSDNGGQNYAEIILVDQELTEKQRQTIEIYLAEKWGLQNSYAYPDWYKGNGPATVYGTGTVNLQTDATLGGAFKGTINLNGNALTMEGAALPPTESVVSTDNLVAWFDPDDETKLITQTVASKVPSTRLNWLNDKVRGFETGSLALHSRQYTRAAGIDRSAHDMGPVRTWLDYANLDGSTIYTGCLSAPWAHTGEKAFAGDAAVNVNTIIMAVDSRRGGGTAFFDGSNVNTDSGVIKKRATSDPSTPIYKSGTGTILTGGKTYLDGIEIDGTTQGYNGRAEILSVIPNGDYPLLSFAVLGNSEGVERCGEANSWAEIEGEILLWNRALGDAERNKVEAYLAYKWLGIAQAGYSAMGDATVVGAGTVKAASVDMLPKFGAGFTGTVEVPSVTAFDFTVKTENGVTTCVNPFDLGGGTMVLSGEITVTVNGTGSRPAAGSSIKVFGWGTEPAGVTWKFVQTGTAETRGDLVKKADGIYYEVPTSGMILLVR